MKLTKYKATFCFRTIEVQGIRDAFATVKTAKSCRTDNIFSYLLKLVLPFIENFLAILFNKSIEIHCFPAISKASRVTLIFKDGDDITDNSNYQPMSALPVISRLFEKLQLRIKLSTHFVFSGGNIELISTQAPIAILNAEENVKDELTGMFSSSNHRCKGGGGPLAVKGSSLHAGKVSFNVNSSVATSLVRDCLKLV